MAGDGLAGHLSFCLFGSLRRNDLDLVEVAARLALRGELAHVEHQRSGKRGGEVQRRFEIAATVVIAPVGGARNAIGRVVTKLRVRHRRDRVEVRRKGNGDAAARWQQYVPS